MSTQKKGSKRKATEETDEPKAKRAKAASDLKAKRAKGETSKFLLFKKQYKIFNA